MHRREFDRLEMLQGIQSDRFPGPVRGAGAGARSVEMSRSGDCSQIAAQPTVGIVNAEPAVGSMGGSVP
jgi:hypothetical protein